MRVKDARQTFLGIWVHNLLKGLPIKVFGDGEQLRDFNYVDDCVNALLLAGVNEISNGKVYNLGSNEVLGLKKLALKMMTLGYDGSYEIVPFPKDRESIDIGDYYSDYSLISDELNWLPKINMLSGLTRTMKFYKDNLQEYV
jgi:dTDP-glucose 4,6-dehydratase/UDP-glucose 4-epimerase